MANFGWDYPAGCSGPPEPDDDREFEDDGPDPDQLRDEQLAREVDELYAQAPKDDPY